MASCIRKFGLKLKVISRPYYRSYKFNVDVFLRLIHSFDSKPFDFLHAIHKPDTLPRAFREYIEASNPNHQERERIGKGLRYTSARVFLDGLESFQIPHLTKRSATPRSWSADRR